MLKKIILQTTFVIKKTAADLNTAGKNSVTVKTVFID